MKSGYFEQAAALSQQIAALKEELQSLETREAMQNEWLERFKKHCNIESLSRQLVTELIEVIYIHEERRITIHFKFQNELEKIRTFVEREAGSPRMAV